MTPNIENIVAQAATLRADIRKHDDLYYSQGHPTIEDAEYDGLMQRLREIEAAYPETRTPDSPTQRVGITVLEGFAKRKHAQPMLSLDNVFDEENLRKFYDKTASVFGQTDIEMCIEPKIDGLAVSVIYENGALVAAVTRGTGVEGDDVTLNARTIRNLPLQLSCVQTGRAELRGEIYMSRVVFAKVNQRLADEGENLLANPRNAAVGALKSLDPNKCAEKELSVIFYHLIQEGFALQYATYFQMLNYMHNILRVPTIIRYATPRHDMNGLRCSLWDLEKLRKDLPFDTDGAVIKVSSLTHQKHLGAGSRFPEWAVAYKFPPEKAWTRLLDVDYQVGRTGALTPVARLQPVLLSGSVVSNATLHNFNEVARLGIYPGCEVAVQKAGEIIPACVEVRDPVYVCPVCNFIGTESAQQKHHASTIQPH